MINNKKRIFLYGFYGLSNVGNESMLRAFTEPIRSHFNGEVEFIVANRHPSKDYDEKYGVRTISNFEYETREKVAGRWLRGLNPDDSQEFYKIVREIANSDLAVIGPGQYLVETGEIALFRGALAQFAVVSSICQLTHTPLYGMALTAEPIRSPWSKLLIDSLLPSIKALTFRDPKSVDNLLEAGIRIPPYQVFGDTALISDATDSEQADNVLKNERIPHKTGPRLALAMRSIYWLNIDEDEFRRKIANVLQSWLKDKDRDIIAIPQNTYHIDGERDDDRVAAGKIINLLPKSIRNRVYQIHGEHDPCEIEAIYGGCDVTLSARLHGGVFSCKQGTPPVVFTFMDKTRGFFNNLKHEECMIELNASEKHIITKLEDFLSNRLQYSKSILKDVARVRQESKMHVNTAIELLKSPTNGRYKWSKTIINNNTE